MCRPGAAGGNGHDALINRQPVIRESTKNPHLVRDTAALARLYGDPPFCIAHLQRFLNGRADISIDPALLRRFAVDGREPRTVLVVHVETVYFQCSRAIVRAGLWEPETRIERSSLPSTGTILSALSNAAINAQTYDQTQTERVKATLY